MPTRRSFRWAGTSGWCGTPARRGPNGRTVATRRRSGPLVHVHVQRLINETVPDEPDPAAANALQEGLGGQSGEMQAMMQYLF